MSTDHSEDMALKIFVCFLCVAVASGMFAYRFQIPNGLKVPNPCTLDTTTDIWNGVGHINPGGAGDRNLFGLDFASAGHQWTEDLCHKDSDGDGKSNGVELGDIHCTWRTGQNLRSHPTGHPGICEPIDSPKCVQINTGQHGVATIGHSCPS